MNSNLHHLASHERVASIRSSAAASHLAATQAVQQPDQPRAIRRPRPTWRRLARPLATP